MIRHLDRYVAKQFLVTATALVVGLPLLFVISTITEKLDQHFRAGLDAMGIAVAYLYAVPQFVVWSLPIAALIATVFTVGALTRNQELVAAKAGGISFYRVVAPILLLGMVMGTLGLVLNDVVPITNRIHAEMIGERRDFRGTLRSDFVHLTESGHSLAVQRLDPMGGNMSGVILEGRGRDGAAALHLVAERARWEEDAGWILEDGVVRLLDGSDLEVSYRFRESRVPGLVETPNDLLARPKDPDEMRYEEMSRAIRTFERSGGDTRELRTKRAEKISLPLATLVIVLFGAPLATSSKRGGTAYGIGVSLAVTMIYLLLFRVGSALGSSGALPPTFAAWLPNLIFLAAGLFLFWRVRT